LLHAIDRTRSPMGKRLLRQWLRTPLADVEPIVQRQRAIAALLDHPTQLDTLGDLLAGVCDIERIVTRVTVSRVGPRDLASLRDCLRQVPMIAAELEPIGVGDGLCEHVEFAKDQAAKLKAAILEEPAPHLREGGVIAKGFDADLDELRTIGRDAKTWLADYQQRLSQTNDIGSLKVGYNRVFGYYIEVTNAHKDKVDPSWVRKQTLKDCERYITDELKQFEDKALGAKDRSIALEAQLFERVRRDLLPSVRQFQAVAAALAELDVLAALAKLARERRYCRPTITDERVLHIEDGKHPVLEQQLAGEFVANDLAMAAGDCLGLITGPNMAGKSTYIRQVALIVLLAQIGSCVPAKAATVGVADRLFTRIGASDEIHAGQSTFMVEMTETANLLNNATDRSVIILDEIGRGTSTLDGLSLAWAIAEHLAGKVKARTLFATHYHELTDLAEQLPGVRNLSVAVREWQDDVVFLHRIVEGRADKSYGIHVARLAGVPKPVLGRAKTLLADLAVHHAKEKQVGPQMTLFADPDAELGRALRSALTEIDCDELSPRAAHEQLVQLVALLKEAEG
ncbi:MAG: DNA mismatch repair protein MutS, partial [Planctomycetota bacterium]